MDEDDGSHIDAERSDCGNGLILDLSSQPTISLFVCFLIN